jgi:hypothetical protein
MNGFLDCGCRHSLSRYRDFLWKKPWAYAHHLDISEFILFIDGAAYNMKQQQGQARFYSQ